MLVGAVTRTRLALITPADGHIERYVPLEPAGRYTLTDVPTDETQPAQPGRPQIAVSPDGTTAYVTVAPVGTSPPPGSPPPSMIAAVPLDGGPLRIVAPSGDAPAVSPGGGVLAYASPDLSTTGWAIMLRHLRGNASNPITFETSVATGGPDWPTDLSWLGRRHLLVSSTDGIDLYGSANETWLIDAVPGAITGPARSPERDGERTTVPPGTALEVDPGPLPERVGTSTSVQGWLDATAGGDGTYLAVSGKTVQVPCNPAGTTCSKLSESLQRIEVGTGAVTDTVPLPLGTWLSQPVAGPGGTVDAIEFPEATCDTCAPPTGSPTIVRVEGDRLVPLLGNVQAIAWDPKR